MPCRKARGGCDIRLIKTPLNDETVLSLKAGDRVLLTGYIYAARDAAHKRMLEALERGRGLPIEIKGEVIYYVGPTPPRPGMVIGSAGPTTSYRMDPYTPKLLELGLKGTIGKGPRSGEVVEALKKLKGVYFAATGGAGALLSRCIKKVEVIDYEDLGTEALRRLYVEEMPLTVVNDPFGGDIYREALLRWRR